METTSKYEKFIKYGPTLIVLFVVFIMAIVANLLEKSYNTNLSIQKSYYETNWVCSGEEEPYVVQFPFSRNTRNKCYLSTTLGDVNDGECLILEYQYQNFTVFIDGESIYEYRNPKVDMVHTILGTSIVSIPMKAEYSGKQISIEMTPIKFTEPLQIQHIYLTTPAEYSFHFIQGHTIQLAIGFACIFFALFYLIMFCFLHFKKIQLANMSRVYFLSMCIFSASVGLWILGDLHFIFIFTGSLILNDITSYTMMMVIPIGFVSIIHSIVKKYDKCFFILTCVYLVNLVLQTFLFIIGVLDIANSLFVSQLLMFFGLIAGFVFVVMGSIRNMTWDRITVIVGYLIFGVLMIICIAGYVFGPIDFNYNFWFLTGIVELHIMCTYILFKYIYQILVENSEVQKAKKYAYSDALTGVGNRRGYGETLSHAKELRNLDKISILAFDVNYLKRTNDSKGHLAGDELLIAAANLITSCFIHDDFDHCFRTGGDEFSCIVYSTKEEIERGILEFETKCKEWNGRFNYSISIAYGFAMKQDFPDLELEELSIKADEAMYKRKRRMHNNHE